MPNDHEISHIATFSDTPQHLSIQSVNQDLPDTGAAHFAHQNVPVEAGFVKFSGPINIYDNSDLWGKKRNRFNATEKLITLLLNKE